MSAFGLIELKNSDLRRNIWRLTHPCRLVIYSRRRKRTPPRRPMAPARPAERTPPFPRISEARPARSRSAPPPTRAIPPQGARHPREKSGEISKAVTAAKRGAAPPRGEEPRRLPFPPGAPGPAPAPNAAHAARGARQCRTACLLTSVFAARPEFAGCRGRMGRRARPGSADPYPKAQYPRSTWATGYFRQPTRLEETYDDHEA